MKTKCDICGIKPEHPIYAYGLAFCDEDCMEIYEEEQHDDEEYDRPANDIYGDFRNYAR